MNSRKTVNVADLVKRANNLLDHDGFSPEFRKGVASFVEGILHETGNYAGFNYNYWMRQGADEWRAEGQPDFPEKCKYLGDQSMIHFYLHKNLRED